MDSGDALRRRCAPVIDPHKTALRPASLRRLRTRQPTLAAAPLRAKMLTDLAHWASIVLLAHAAFSCVHFKSLVDDPKLVPPTDVVIEVLVSVLLATYSSVAAAPPLKPIRCGQDVSPEVQDAAFHAPEFAHVHHRGKALAARRRALKAASAPRLVD